jgi:hypothetical protein
MKDPKSFVKTFKKSYDYPDSLTIIDAKDQQAAEEGTPSTFLEKITSQMKKGDNVHKIQMQKGVLTLALKDSNLYSGFFTDADGQVVEKFDGHTVEMVAKTLIVKGRVTDYDLYGEAEDYEPQAPAIAPVLSSSAQPQVTIKFGDVEIQLRKSVRQFVDDFKKGRTDEDEIIRKSIRSWRRSQINRYESDREAAQAIIANWEANRESFNQTVFAIRQMSRK